MGLVSLKEQIDNMVKDQLRLVDLLMRRSGLPVVPDQRTGLPVWIDVRELPLRFTISVNRIRKFFEEGLAQRRLLATKCKKCGSLYFPPQSDCPRCRASDMDWIEVSKEGELLTWTVVNVKPLSFFFHKDYVVGIVKMPEGFNVLAWVVVDDPKMLKVGQRVRLVVDKREPEGYYTYWFESI